MTADSERPPSEKAAPASATGETRNSGSILRPPYSASMWSCNEANKIRQCRFVDRIGAEFVTSMTALIKELRQCRRSQRRATR